MMTDVVWLPDEVRFRELVKVREDAAWDVTYGLPHGQHPFDYRPDIECCTVEERQAWVNACLAAERGEPFEYGQHSHEVTPEGQIVIGSTVTSWGIGTYVVHDPEPWLRA